MATGQHQRINYSILKELVENYQVEEEKNPFKKNRIWSQIADHYNEVNRSGEPISGVKLSQAVRN